MTKQFKYASEYSIGMYLGSYQFLQQTELEEFAKHQKVFNDNNPCNIYFILKRPRLSLDKNYIKVTNDFIELKYYIHIEDKKLEKYIKMSKLQEYNNINIVTEYPYNTFELIFNKSEKSYFKLSALVDDIQQYIYDEEPKLDYEVLYIGQAFGQDGKRTAIDRLGSHSTLQKIYSEAMQRNPDSEIWLLLGNFMEQTFGVMSGQVKIPKENEEEDLNRFTNFMNRNTSNFTDKQKINFTEAALIQMYLPKYNKEYKGTFPSQNHSSYDECYKLGVNGIVIETDTSNWRRWLFTEHLPRRKKGEMGIPFWQHAEFHFVNEDDRYKMFNNEYL